MARTLDKRLVVSLIALGTAYLILCLAMVQGWVSQYHNYQLRKNGVATEARITMSNPPRRKAPALLDYQFELDGKTFSGGEGVSRAVQEKYPVGSAIPVRYLPYSPHINGLAEQHSSGMHAVLFLVLCVITFSVIAPWVPVGWAIAKGQPILKPGALWKLDGHSDPESRPTEFF